MAEHDIIIIQDTSFQQPLTPAITITKSITIKGVVSNTDKQPRLRGTWNLSVDIFFENVSLIEVTIVGAATIGIDTINCLINDLVTPATRNLIVEQWNCLMFNSSAINLRSIESHNSFIVSDINVGRTIDYYNVKHEGDLVAGIDATVTSIMTNSFVDGNITVTGGLEKDNSVITGTETVTGTTTEKQQTQRETIKVPLGARGTDHTTGTNKIGFHIDYAFFLESVTLEFDPIETNAGPTGSSFIVDVNVADIDGTSLATILSTKLSVDAGEYHSSTAATPAVISTNAISQYKFISIDIDQIGNTLAGKGGFVTLNGYRT